MVSEKIQIGIIGTGKHGSRYANHLVNDLADRFILQGISRRSKEGRDQAKLFGCQWFPDWRELVAAENVDALISATTPNLNLAIAKACAAHNKPLLLEKPVATTYEAAKEIVTLFDGIDPGLTIGQTLRYNTVILALKSQMRQMGSLFSFYANQRLEPSSLSWLEDPDIAGGGVIYHTAVHMFDALRFITGLEIVRVSSSTANVYNSRLEDLLTAQLELSNGALGILDTSKVSPSRAGRYEFVCESGQLEGDQVHGLLGKIKGASRESLPVQPPGPAILPLLEDWYQYLTGAGKNPIPGEAGLAAVKICHACNLANQENRWVDLDQL